MGAVGNTLAKTHQSCLYLLTFNAVRTIESQPTASGDVPKAPCTIIACGELDPSDPSLLPAAAGADGDPYEDYPQDQDALSDGDIQEKPEVALRVAREIREIGNKLFKEGKTEEALNKYQSTSNKPPCIRTRRDLPCCLAEAVRYLDVHPVLPDDAPPELGDSYGALLAPLLLNSALAAIRAGRPQAAVDSATRALDRLGLNDADKGASLPQLGFDTAVLKIGDFCSKGALPPCPRTQRPQRGRRG